MKVSKKQEIEDIWSVKGEDGLIVVFSLRDKHEQTLTKGWTNHWRMTLPSVLNLGLQTMHPNEKAVGEIDSIIQILEEMKEKIQSKPKKKIPVREE